MPYSLELELAIYPTDANQILGVNKYLKHRVFTRVKNEIHLLTRGKAPLEPLTQFVISVTRMSPQFMDYDNLIGMLKPAIDGLKLSGIIQDDSWQYIRHIETNQIKSKDKKLIIKVTETSEAECKST
jgi:Holliday junction resolvase RusA-like endonuclease